MTRKIRSLYQVVKRSFRPWRRRGVPARSYDPLKEIARLRAANANLIQTNAALIADHDKAVEWSRFLAAKAAELEYELMLRRIEEAGKA